jgi:murein DD-endopeptidase MepM/ murein hydrolase activator NlpD
LEAAREDLPSVGEDEEDPKDAERDEKPGSFDPGLTTGYLRRSRDHDLPVEIGAAPFEPGPGTGYDERRARRAEKRQRREDEKRRDRLAALAAEIEQREQAEREAREREEREREERIERESAERERAEREARERLEHEEAERRLAAQRERERLELDRQERVRALRERRRREHQERELRLRRARAQRRHKEQNLRQARRPARARTRPAQSAIRPRRRPAKQAGLGWPTARAAVALAAVSAVAGVFGTAIGLPVPVLGEPGGPIAASLTGNSLLDSGTAPGLTKGPFFPVVTDNPDFGEADAKFGAGRSGHIHQGQDVIAKPGTPLVAVRDGIVIDGGGGKSFYAYGGGNSLVIYSPIDDRSYVYLHLLHPATVQAGETVQAGQPVGQVGCSGSCDGPHLHFEIRLGRVAYGVERKAIDPLPFLQQWPGAP